MSFLSCNLQGKKDFLDNPTAEPITFELNGKAYTLSGFSSQKVNLKIGKHSLKTPDGQLIEFEKKSNSQGSIINPTGSEYVIYVNLYAFSREDVSYKVLFDRYKKFYQQVQLKQKKYFAPMSVTSEYYIDNSVFQWRYGLNEDFESEISSEKLQEWQKKLNFSELLRTKIFRADDFLNQYGSRLYEVEENPLEK